MSATGGWPGSAGRRCTASTSPRSVRSTSSASTPTSAVTASGGRSCSPASTTWRGRTSRSGCCTSTPTTPRRGGSTTTSASRCTTSTAPTSARSRRAADPDEVADAEGHPGGGGANRHLADRREHDAPAGEAGQRPADQQRRHRGEEDGGHDRTAALGPEERQEGYEGPQAERDEGRERRLGR